MEWSGVGGGKGLLLLSYALLYLEFFNYINELLW